MQHPSPDHEASIRGWAKPSLMVVAFGVIVAGAAIAHAALNRKVEAAFRGQILITEQPLDLEEGGDPARIIADCKKQTLLTVKHVKVGGTPVWTFYYTAFLKQKPRLTELSLDFYTTDAEALYVADKKLGGVDPGVATLQGKVEISEDDGLTRGRTYLVKVTGVLKKREIVFATATVTMK